jgi:UDPglucose 6-dehydrogenase
MLELPLAPFERIIPSDVSEMVKYACNTYFAIKNIYANQIYEICDKIEIDYEAVKDCIAADKRIERTHLDVWHNYLQKGRRGYTGACLPKDVKAFLKFAENIGINPSLIKEADTINDGYDTSKKSI